MNKQIEALKMAVEELHNALKLLQRFTPQAVGDGSWTAWTVGLKNQLSDLQHTLYNNGFVEAINACKEALAEAALNKMQTNAEELGLTYCKHGSDDDCKECYMEQAEAEKQEPVAWLSTESKANEIIKTNPATWQSLSDVEIDNIWSMNFEFGFRACARAIEQASKAKNT